jgi:hypothetical protein
MIALHKDADMAGQLERTLVGAYVGSADLGEALAIAEPVAGGDYAGWYAAWSKAAEQTSANAAEAPDDIAARAYLRAAEYWRQSYYFLRDDLADDRVRTGYAAQRDAFRAAFPHLGFSAEAVTIPYEGAGLPGYLFRPRSAEGTRPTVLLPGGFDDTAEERIKHGVVGALELGWNALAWDGPGQGGVLVQQGLTMRPDFEAVLTPVVDWVVQQPGVDPEALALVGRSLAGYFAPRGATGEQRIKALVCDPGQYDFASRLQSMFKAGEWERVLNADPAMDEQLQSNLEGPRNRYMYGSRMAAMGAKTYGEWLRIQANYTLKGRVSSIACPTLITEGEGDFASEGQVLYDALTCEKEFRKITAAEGGAGHCCGLGQQVWTQIAFGWLAKTIA